MKKLLALALAMVMVLALAACGGTTSPSPSNSATPTPTPSQSSSPAAATPTPEPVKPVATGTFRINIGQEPTTLDPQQFRDDNASSIIYAIHEPLIRISGETGREWEPGLASDVKANADFSVYTVTLRDGLKWADGTPITADDVVYTYQRVLDPALGSPKVADYYKIKNAEAIYNNLSGAEGADATMTIDKLGVVKVSDTVVEIQLETPLDYFFDVLKTPTYAPVQKAMAEKEGQLYGTEADKTMASGPFVITTWQHNTGITLTKNENYWDADNVNFAEVDITLSTDANAVMGMYDSGSLDYLKIDQDVANSPKYDGSKHYVDSIRVSFIEFNPKEDIGIPTNFFSNIKIREALSLTFDRRAYAAQIVKQPEIAAYGMVPFGMRGEAGGDFRLQQGDSVYDMGNFPGGDFADTGKSYAAGATGAIARAKDLLEMGLAELGKNKADMEKAVVVHCVNSPGSITQAEAIQQMWKVCLDLNLTVTPLAVPDLLPMLIGGTFQCVVGGGRTAQTFDVGYMLDFIYYEGKWSDNTEFMTSFEQTLKMTGDARIAKFKEIENYVLNQFIFIPQVYGRTNYVVRDNIEGLRVYPLAVQFDYKYITIK